MEHLKYEDAVDFDAENNESKVSNVMMHSIMRIAE